ncbi:MAG TPA: DUF1549 domain-containing protein [Pirellulales bacterium]|nr:DUF1549 domain-containing protein [Pirellulales bacterium]
MSRLISYTLRPALATALGVFVLFAQSAFSLAGDIAGSSPSRPATPGLGDPGTLRALAIDTGRPAGSPTLLRGKDSQQQLVVNGQYSSGQVRDLTRQVVYEAAPAGIVSVDSTGLVLPLADGRATVAAVAPTGQRATVELVVENQVVDTPVNFPNQIVPVFTKLGCNSGGCHGKASGQNGFKLSLLGFEPGEDFEHLVKEGRGRRLFPASPDRSLLLLKPINVMPHGGGQRTDANSHEYKLLRRWIEQGMPYGKPDDPTVTKIEVVPAERSMQRGGEQQIIVLAHYTDGSIEDVTRVATYDPNDGEMAECTPTGLVKTLDLTGDVAIMARYQGQVGVFRASIPLGVPVDNLPLAKSFIDELVFKKLKTLGVPPSAICDDSTFIRRVSIDLAGRLPLAEETEQFLADPDPAKRDKLVDRLLDSAEYADYFANKWAAVLRNRRRTPSYTRGSYAFHGWIRDSLYENKPYDQFVREILAASGEIGENPPVVWYREVKEVDQQVEDCAQLFLGLRIQCARCHHHPFEKWSQRDYYGMTAFFSQVGRKPGSMADEQRIFHRRGQAAATNPKTGERLLPTGLGSEPNKLAPERDPRQALADWLADPANPFFARALVNRYWKHVFGRGIVDPEDDMRVTNPASNPELLSALAEHFIASRFDLKDLLRTIAKSSTYQLSAEPNQYNLNDKQNFSRYYPKRLTAEVLLDSLDLVTGSTTGFNGLPAGTRAVELPDTGANTYFLTVFGRPEGASACECERSQEANLAQSLHLLNSAEVQGKLSNAQGRAAQLAKDDKQAPEEKIRSLYLSVFSRMPISEEVQVALAHVNRVENKQQAYEDILWALVNTKEFLFNH